jgi:hypothetical protein
MGGDQVSDLFKRWVEMLGFARLELQSDDLLTVAYLAVSAGWSDLQKNTRLKN